jgi:ATP-dependent Clp protease ATP-binding subunit ClpC
MSNYTDILQEGEDVSASARAAGPVWFRDQEIDAATAAVLGRRSVLLVGPPGTGKSAVLHGIAARLDQLMQNGVMIGMRRFTTTQILSGTRYIGDWQTKLTQLMVEAELSNAVLNVVDVWNLASVGMTVQSENNLLDAMRPRIADGRLCLISEVTPEQLQQMSYRTNFVPLFEIVRIEPLSDQQRREILDREATRTGLTLPLETRERMLALADSFSPGAGAGATLDLLRKMREYWEQKIGANEPVDMTPRFAEKVFSIHSGLPIFVVSRTATMPASEIRDWFRERIIGQEGAIDAVVEMIAFYKARLHDKGKPVGSFLFVGPTGVGKTELARCLAAFFFGSERRMLRFDMSEFADYNSFELLIGSPQTSPRRPARLIDPVRLQPFQVLLFDELEKAHRNVQDLFLQLLDEGRLTTPAGETVNFCTTIIIATSNAGALEGMTSGIGFGDRNETYDADKALSAIESQFRPEFLNRFQHLVLFHPLTREQAARIARIDLQGVLRREGIAGQNLLVDVHDDVIDHVLAAGFNPRYGGRGIKREVRRRIILPIANLLLERALDPGTIIDVRLVDGRVRVRAVDTPESLEHKSDRAPVRAHTGERLALPEINERVGAAGIQLAALAANCELPRLLAEIDQLDAERRSHTFWTDPDHARQALARQARSLETVARLEGLHNVVEDLERAATAAASRRELAGLAEKLVNLETALAIVERELVGMGPDGYWDALMEIVPVGQSGEARDFLFELYGLWAKDRRTELVMLREPLSTDEPLAVAFKGHFAYGYLCGEAGRHRLRRKHRNAVARVTVAALTDASAPIAFAEQRPLKATGQLGGKVRSRVAVASSRLVLQNERTLDQNRELAREVAPSWPHQLAAANMQVRRYDFDPFLVRDYLIGEGFGRKEILKPRLFHKLLCDRIDVTRRNARGERDVG